MTEDLRVHPVTSERWGDLVALFGPDRGAYAGCWCMWWRQTAREHQRRQGTGNRRALRRLVARDRPPGLLAYLEGAPVGWVSVAPREEFGRLERSRLLGPVDDAASVWSIVCFYIDRRHRRRGVGAALLRAAVDHAAAHGARIVEGYPVETGGGKRPGGDLYTGVPSMFEGAGFEEVARRSPTRPIMRWRPDRRRG